MKHIIDGIEETLKEYEIEIGAYKNIEVPPYKIKPFCRLKTATDIFNYVLSELEINAEALRDSERRSISAK